MRIWQLRSLITRITAILINYDKYFNTSLRIAPDVIDQGRHNIEHIRQRYQLLRLQTTRIKQLFWIINQSYQIWRKI